MQGPEQSGGTLKFSLALKTENVLNNSRGPPRSYFSYDSMKLRAYGSLERKAVEQNKKKKS